MKKTFAWVCVADPKSQYICEVYGPCTEHMMGEINAGLSETPIQGLPENIAEVLCEIRLVVPGIVPNKENFNEVIYMPGYFECRPVWPLKVRSMEKVPIAR
jgi:hypothetical protein